LSIWCPSPPSFKPNDRIISIAYHPPEIEPGTHAVVVCPRVGTLYAVELPDGEIHRWFAWFELQPLYPNPSQRGYLCPGDSARVLTDEGHAHHIRAGMIVKIVKVIMQTPFYDVLLHGHDYHRWLAEFEVTAPI
jgi:hypothetical protein